MRKQDFNSFYDIVIEPCINAIREDARKRGYHNLECFRISRENNQILKKQIYRHYQKKRDYIKYNYMSKRGEAALDRHKVASCMVYAILKTNPVKVNMKISHLPFEIVLSNEYLAFYVALNIIEMYELDRIQDQEINGYSNESFSNIVIPRTYYESDNPDNTYESNLCKAWYYIKIENMKKYDVLGYANVFFLLQKYSEIYRKWRMAIGKSDKLMEG